MKLSSIFILYCCDEAMPDLLAVALVSSSREKRFASERRDFITSGHASQAFKSKSLYLRLACYRKNNP
jgi:hypothetical protein